MREILFRGKRLDDGEWVEGYLFKSWEECYILWGTRNGVPNMHKVIPKTVGQFTGLLDKNGKKIFDGDIVTDDNIHYEIYFDEEDMGFMGYSPKHGTWAAAKYLSSNEDLEVIGNIYDNKES